MWIQKRGRGKGQFISACPVLHLVYSLLLFLNVSFAFWPLRKSPYLGQTWGNETSLSFTNIQCVAMKSRKHVYGCEHCFRSKWFHKTRLVTSCWRRMYPLLIWHSVVDWQSYIGHHTWMITSILFVTIAQLLNIHVNHYVNLGHVANNDIFTYGDIPLAGAQIVNHCVRIYVCSVSR